MGFSLITARSSFVILSVFFRGGGLVYWYVFLLTFAACVLRGSLSGKISRSSKPLALALRSFAARAVSFLSGKKDGAQEESGQS